MTLEPRLPLESLEERQSFSMDFRDLLRFSKEICKRAWGSKIEGA
jgi:hypothetical protein